MARKTVNVEEIRDYANTILAEVDNPTWNTLKYKLGICVMLEKALHLSGNYNGFVFLNPDDSEVNTIGYYTRHYF